MVNEASRTAHLLAICDEAVTLVELGRVILVSSKLVKPEHVRSLVEVARFLTSVGLAIGDEFAEVSINVLTSFEIDGTTKTYVFQSAMA
jgi:hypothetical protein